MAHAAQIALAFLAGVGDEEDGGGRDDLGVFEGGDDGEEGGEAGAVVAGAGAENARAVFGGCGGGSGGEDGVEVSGKEDVRACGLVWIGAR